MSHVQLAYVLSGGQTGADQAGLRAAAACGVATSGMMPRGCHTDAGDRPDLAGTFNLRVSRFDGYAPRTRWNVKNSGGTIWFGDVTSPGGRLTEDTAHTYQKPFLVVPYDGVAQPPDHVLLANARGIRYWLDVHQITCVNIAGNRERLSPGIGSWVEQILTHAFSASEPLDL